MLRQQRIGRRPRSAAALPASRFGHPAVCAAAAEQRRFALGLALLGGPQRRRPPRTL